MNDFEGCCKIIYNYCERGNLLFFSDVFAKKIILRVYNNLNTVPSFVNIGPYVEQQFQIMHT